MRGYLAVDHIYRPVRCGVSRARHAGKDPRRGARRPRDRIRLAYRFETIESRPRSGLRADVVAQRIHGAVGRVAEGTDALTGSRTQAFPVVCSKEPDPNLVPL